MTTPGQVSDADANSHPSIIHLPVATYPILLAASSDPTHPSSQSQQPQLQPQHQQQQQQQQPAQSQPPVPSKRNSESEVDEVDEPENEHTDRSADLRMWASKERQKRFGEKLSRNDTGVVKGYGRRGCCVVM